MDFDNTIANHDGPFRSGYFGELIPGAVDALTNLKRMGYKIIIWTVRDDSVELREFLDSNNIPYDRVNTPYHRFTQSPKVYADLYIDDRSLHFDGDWEKVVAKVTGLTC